MSCDPWDEVPTALEEDDEGPERWDPDELLARCLHRARHAGGSHLFGDWRGIYHGLRAGNAKLRAEAERVALAERLAGDTVKAAQAVRGGHPDDAAAHLRAALARLGER